MTEPNKQIKILLIDDDRFLLDMYSLKFKKSGFDIDTSGSSSNALEKLRNAEKYDVILLDIIMPKMSGIEVIEKLREDTWGKNVSIFFMTNVNSNDAIMEKIIKYTPSYYFLKGGEMRPHEIINKIREKFKQS